MLNRCDARDIVQLSYKNIFGKELSLAGHVRRLSEKKLELSTFDSELSRPEHYSIKTCAVKRVRSIDVLLRPVEFREASAAVNFDSLSVGDIATLLYSPRKGVLCRVSGYIFPATPDVIALGIASPASPQPLDLGLYGYPRNKIESCEVLERAKKWESPTAWFYKLKPNLSKEFSW